jgi:hypothetical protein
LPDSLAVPFGGGADFERLALFVGDAALVPVATFLAPTLLEGAAFLATGPGLPAAFDRADDPLGGWRAGALLVAVARPRPPTTLSTPGPGLSVLSSPDAHRIVMRRPLTRVTTPDRGPALDDATSTRSPTFGIQLPPATGRVLPIGTRHMRCRDQLPVDDERAIARSPHGPDPTAFGLPCGVPRVVLTGVPRPGRWHTPRGATPCHAPRRSGTSPADSREVAYGPGLIGGGRA